MITDKKDTRPPQHGPSTHSRPRPQAYNTWYKEKPFRPPYYHTKPGLEGPLHENPSLHQYEQIFSHQFLDPPKPGGFGQLKTLPRHWPVSYLHKESPPNATADIVEEKDNRKLNRSQNKYNAINNLMQTIKDEEKRPLSAKIQKQDMPSKEEEEELLLVRIPMTESPQDKDIKLEVVDTKNVTRIKHLDKSNDFDDLFLISLPRNKIKVENRTDISSPQTIRTPKRDLQVFPIRRGYVTRTNRTSIRRRRVQKPIPP